MADGILKIPALLARRIGQEGLAAYPNECCGILIGREQTGQRTVERLLPAENVFDDVEQRPVRFSIDPRMLMQADRAATEQGTMVLGFYHSHPDHPARPSEYDRQHAWPFYSYVIVSVTREQALDMTSWTLDEETNLFQRQEIEEI